MGSCRLGPAESFKTKLKRCQKDVRKTLRAKGYKKGAEFAICKRSVSKFAGKQRRKVYSGKPGYMKLVRRGAPKCPTRRS